MMKWGLICTHGEGRHSPVVETSWCAGGATASRRPHSSRVQRQWRRQIRITTEVACYGPGKLLIETQSLIRRRRRCGCCCCCLRSRSLSPAVSSYCVRCSPVFSWRSASVSIHQRLPIAAIFYCAASPLRGHVTHCNTSVCLSVCRVLAYN